MFKKVETKLDFVQDELDTIKFWEDKDIFKKCLDNTKRNKEYVFYDGPPTANGKPHIGHVLTRTVKDVIPRYKTMKGFHVQRKAGWDTHGLPVELEVEKELGFTNKDDILKYGIVPFIEKCKVSVWKYKNEWEQMSKRVGYWVDFERPYITYTDDYIESIWWAFKKIDEKGLLYDGFKILPYCPRCGTSLSSHEVDQNYKTVKEVSIFVKFKVKNEKDSFILAWTTTPWTLPSNVALCVNPKNDYVQIKVGEEKYILAENLVATLFEKYEVIKKFKGKDIEYLEYEPLFVSKIKLKQKAFYITCDEYVTLDSGTGVVHLAPAFGEDDAKVGSKYNLPFLQLVNSKGEFVKESEFADMPVKKANVAVIENLKSRNLLFKELMFEHNYPHCWRCDTPLIYYANKSWFVKMSAVKDNLVANNQKVNWLPPAFKNGRMGNFLENVKDWCISRNRYWGTPLPVWKCECGHHHVVGSKKELFELTQKTIPELHKPYIDELQIVCEKCGKLMSREPEVIDCWFDSGSMPFAQLHYPFENKKEFKKLFPADFISEGSDQSRGWFYSLQALSTVLFGTTPYKSCIALGLINDKNGIKMSKHLGNVITPNEML
ncbi:MAG: isoleucine--tRNA ligase, partial [Clostridia bacterium]|nr:isoleucine--tRNA ligase [Clostridia bacterium]